ncbi:MAG: efflux RND transporter periplasmic adaptor subunit [Verrucomicrobiales bacterium]|nr:efflux RND transporter periplasmic adaptor subunit [Verrucomicrobiales bacterium]
MSFRSHFLPLFFLLLGLTLATAGCRRGGADALLPSGTVEVDETQIGSRYGGRVTEVLVREGDGVTPGQVLARLEADELTARHSQLSALLAELEAGPRVEEIASAKAEWEVHSAELELARKDEERALELFADKTIAANERDRAVSRAQSTAKAAAAAKARYEMLVAGTRPERIAQTRAELSAIAAQQRELTLTAPSAAVVEVVNIKPGDVLAPNRPAMTLLLTNHLWVRVYVPPAWLGSLREGQKVRLHADAFPGRDFPGVIEQVARAAEFTPRNVQTPADRAQQVFGIKIRLEDAGHDLRSGMSVEADFGIPKTKPDA